MYCNILISFSILQAASLAKGKRHMCAFLNSSLNTTDCGTNDKTRCRKVEKECEDGTYGCVSVYENVTGEWKPKHMGCFHADERSGHCGIDRCVLEYHNRHYTCCCSQNMCNINVTFPILSASTTLKPITTRHGDRRTRVSNDHMLLVYILAPVFSILFFVTVLAHLLKKHKDSLRQEHNHLLEQQEAQSPTIQTRSIQILETIHEGQFAKILRAKYLHEVVAVKSVQPLQHELWTNEKNIFEKCNLNHDNILRFISAEKRQYDDVIQFWIITEYCSNGSLGDYLSKRTLTVSDLIRLASCILKGLDYLHSSNSLSITIAHRDIKSTNILVKSDLTCCIADFGLSIAFPLAEGRRKSIDMSQVGTRQYMAPEVLRGAIIFNPECLIAVDMYSFALVAWELLSRTGTSQVVPSTYELPYGKEVGYRPTLDTMIQCVVEGNKRPEFKDKWRVDPVLNVICETVEECWDFDANARVAASLAYLRISRLSAQNSSDENVSSSSSSKDEVKYIIDSSNSTIGQITMLDKEV